jgi:hypothetical protein
MHGSREDHQLLGQGVDDRKAIFWSDGSESYLSQNRSPMNQRRPRCQIKNNISAGVPSPRAHRKRRLSSIVAPSIVCRQPSA